MNKYKAHAHGNYQTIAAGKTAIPDFLENPKPYEGDSTAKRQIEQLTSREIEVLQFIAKGKLNKQAAAELCLSVKTIEKHREHLTKKLGIRGIAALTHFAIHSGIIQCDPQLAMA